MCQGKLFKRKHQTKHRKSTPTNYPISNFSYLRYKKLRSVVTCFFYIQVWLKVMYKNQNMAAISEALPKTLPSHQITLKLVWDCFENLKILSKHSKVTFVWVAGYKGIAVKERFCNNIHWTSRAIIKTAIRGEVAE